MDLKDLDKELKISTKELDEALKIDYKDIDQVLNEGLEDIDEVLANQIDLDELKNTIDGIMNPTEEEKQKTRQVINSFIGQ